MKLFKIGEIQLLYTGCAYLIRFAALVDAVIPQINTLPCFEPLSITSEVTLCNATVSNNACASLFCYYRALQPK